MAEVPAGSGQPTSRQLLEEIIRELKTPIQPKVGLLGRVKSLFQRGKEEKSEGVEGKSWRDSLGERVKEAREGITSGAEGFRQRLENFAQTPFAQSALKTTLELIEDKLKGKAIGKVALSLAAAKFFSRWLVYKGKETVVNIGKSTWEHKGDIVTGAVAGAVFRTAFITAGWEAYLAKAVASGLIAAGRKGWAELESYDKPEGFKVRLNVISRIKALTPEQRRQLRNKVVVAGAFGFGGSVLGMEFIEKTGLGNYLQQTLELGLEKGTELLGEAGQFIQEKGAGMPKPQFATPTEIPTATPAAMETAPPGISTPYEAPAEIPTLTQTEAPTPIPTETLVPTPTETPIPTQTPAPTETITLTPTETLTLTADSIRTAESSPIATPTPAPIGEIVQPALAEATPEPIISAPTATITPTEVPPPAEVTTGEIPSEPQEVQTPQAPTIPQPAAAQPEVPTTPVLPVEVSPVDKMDQLIKNLPPQMSTPPTGGWGVSENLLKMLGPDVKFTHGDIIEVDKALCIANGVSVPEWNIQGDFEHRRLPPGFQFKIDDNVKDVLKNVSLRAASR